MTKIKVFTLLMGVALLGVAAGEIDQSEASNPQHEEPMEIEENEENAREGQRETPEVVLQLKYVKGGLNRIYLAQYRKEQKSWMPSVPARQGLCSDLCHAGLGGDVCGSSCSAMLPVGLQQALAANDSGGAVYGEPRFSVCPSLCQNHLGYPLCHCEEWVTNLAATLTEDVAATPQSADWDAVCNAFCHTDSYVLSGCPPCTPEQAALVTSSSARALGTATGWHAWCNTQCRQGHGGAACNCDKAPF